MTYAQQHLGEAGKIGGPALRDSEPLFEDLRDAYPGSIEETILTEIIANSVDAGASRIDVATSGGGLRLIRVADDGSGMGASDLALAVERHATSKLAGDDLSSIMTLGFRGEALPSIGAVARLSIQSRAQGAAPAYFGYDH